MKVARLLLVPRNFYDELTPQVFAELRNDLGFTVDELATKIGFGPDEIRRYETNGECAYKGYWHFKLPMYFLARYAMVIGRISKNKWGDLLLCKLHDFNASPVEPTSR